MGTITFALITRRRVRHIFRCDAIFGGLGGNTIHSARTVEIDQLLPARGAADRCNVGFYPGAMASGRSSRE
jgi:hypothetical protein